MLTLPGTYVSLEEYTNHLCRFLTTPLVRQITGGIHVNDALIHDAWQKLPLEWTAWWSTWSDHRLAQQDLIDGVDEDAVSQSPNVEGQSRLAESRPPSLTKWLNTLRSLALSRTQRPGTTVVLPEILSTHMSPKKIAEVSRAVAHIQTVCQQKDIFQVIDMGSGQGYLSISLAYLFPHLRILSIDGSRTQITGSQALADSLIIPNSRLETMVCWIDGTSSIVTAIEDWAKGEKCMLVGLHACGSLTDYMLRYFTTVSCIDAIAVIGCCYNHINPRSPSHPTGFPTSSAIRKHNVTLSATALMTGCQSPNNWKRPDLQSSPREYSSFSKRRLYRAVLQKIFHDKGVQVGGQGDKRPAWGTRKSDLTSFTKFADRAMDCLGVERDRITSAELVSYEKRHASCEGQIAILWTLGALCCKVVESVIAMDRLLFLSEEGATGLDVVPIFDMAVSPRNLMLVAEKDNSTS